MHRNLSQAALSATAGYLLAVPVLLVGIEGWSGFDIARLLQWPLLMLASWASVSMAWPATRWSPARSSAWLATAAVATLAVVLAPVPAMALRELAVICGLVALAYLISRAHGWHQTLLRTALVATGGYALLITGLVLVVTLGGETVSRRDLFVGYDNHRFYSHVLTAAMPLVLAARLALQGRSWRFAADATLALSALMMFATGGRGTMAALAGSTVLALICLGRAVAWPAVRPLVTGWAVGLAAFTLLFLWVPGSDPGASSMADYSAGRLTSDQARLPLWQRALDMALASPWIGAGPMHFAHGQNTIAAHPHSLPLQIAAEWGLPMLAVVVLAIGLVLRHTWRRLGTAHGAPGLGIALSIGFVAVLLDALVSGNFVVPMSQVWIAVLFGLFWGWLRSASRVSERSSKVPSRVWSSLGRMATIAVALLQLWLGTQMLPEAAHIGDHLEAAMVAFPAERHQPRFWSHGRF